MHPIPRFALIRYHPPMPSSERKLPTVLISIALAIGLTALFWWPLWTGGGLIGGDIYSYFFPQKTYFADQWREGRIPLWNPLVGHGYPVLGESQTGSLYPSNLLLYRMFDVNTAYNISQLAHLVLAFVGMALFSLKLGLRPAGSIFAAVVYVFGWLPPRMCLEWAPIGAAYLPWQLLCIESWVQTGRFRWLTPLPWLIGLHLLAGHYNLAFINLLVCGVWLMARLLWATDGIHARPPSRRWGAIGLALGMIVLGFALAAPQVLATWELKQLSQRADVGDVHNPGYGHIPPLYLLQTIAPWMWYPPEIDFDVVMQQLDWGAYPAPTNKVEAHLYFGLLPLLMAALAAWRLRSQPAERRTWLVWIVLAVAATIYTTGWLLPITQYLPGFNYFMGPGRYGIITTLVVGLLAGKELDHWTAARYAKSSRLARHIAISVVVLAITLVDLWWISRCVFYAVPVATPPIDRRNESQLRQLAMELGPNARLFAPGQNLPTLTGFAASPPYLGLGPAEYFDPALKPPYADVRDVPPEDVDQQVAWMRDAGITHLLCQEPLSPRVWLVELVWEGFDAMLNPAWARFDQPLYLYRLQDAPGRAYYAEAEAIESGSEAEVLSDAGDRVEISVSTPEPAILVLTDLWYPGWEVEIDGKAADGRRYQGMFRAVDVPAGQHRVTWSYRPPLIRWGFIISGLAALAAGCLFAATFRRPREGV